METNKYGGYAEEPFDAKKARELTDKKIRTTHFAPISWALASAKTAAERGLSEVTLSCEPWTEETPYRDEMMMHLRDRGFTVTHIPGNKYEVTAVKVEW